MFNLDFPDWDTDLFVYLNSKSTDWLDPVMILLSTYTAWFFLCILVMIFMIYRNSKQGAVASLYLLIGLAMNTILNLIVKAIFVRPRPGNEDFLKDLIRQLEEAGTSYSFFSAHSSNSICLAVFTTLYFRNKIYGILIFAWAVAVAYSRIYVGKHYPLDVVVGILFGLLTGWLSFWFFRTYGRKKELPEEEKMAG